jgi:hypothetical protein
VACGIVAAMPHAWTPARHRPLRLVADGLWEIDAEMSGPPFQRRMTLIRLASGELVVHSAVACDAATMAQIDGIGPVGYIVVPNPYHRMDAPAFAARYPAARVVTPQAAARRVRKVVRVDGGLDLLPADPALRWEPLDGVLAEAVLIHTDAQGALTLVFNDVFFNIVERPPGMKGMLLSAVGSFGAARATPIAKLFIIQDRRAFLAHLQRLAALPGLARIVPGHGAIIDVGAAAAVASVAASLG